eukprot:CAMPEP_0194167610 /NCGR_PEP_ID=MMETSP0154-20130528/2829_1 /TAXON_ID=1049557 /ORGANISM="Thalassiothrix antarctica, Strain L6-D1" /LENGTH=465 /DNA_ID=CAMNT_0038878545 /DNA_START=1 /DNA_END=1394 /DNA_ORIENTATION=+
MGSRKGDNRKSDNKIDQSKNERNVTTNIYLWGIIGVTFTFIVTCIHCDYFGNSNDIYCDNFQKWFIDHGGWMMSSILLEKTNKYGNSLKFIRKTKEGLKIFQKEMVIETPLSLVFTRDKAMKKLALNISPEKYRRVAHIINKYFSNNLLEQHDTWIAIDLLLECLKGDESLWFPYLQLLPEKSPRLSDFNEKEYSFLQDDILAMFGRSQRKVYVSVWNHGIQRALADIVNISSLEAMRCLTIDSFHHYVSLVASRAMILDDELGEPTKYLTPMADMINHADNPSKNEILPSSASHFHLYHQIQKEKDSIVVYADRTFREGDIIVEEYGKLDNSLYLTAFGFVPKNNHYHCVMLPLPGHEHGDPEECVQRDGSLLDIELEQSLALSLLSPSFCKTTEECWNHPERKPRLQSFWQLAAQSKLDASPTCLEEDEALLRDLGEDGVETSESRITSLLWKGMKRNHAHLA